MKGIVPYHKTPKFGDLSPDPTSKLSNSHGLNFFLLYFNIFNRKKKDNFKCRKR